jgi:hypothetical protein
MKRLLALLLVSVPAFAAGPATTNNDDSCDISLLPAATLLLPYFEVDLNSPQTTAQTTIFTIQNTTAMPQIARVTLWTDWSYPMLTFNIFLTGYDVQGINLWDVFRRGTVAPTGNTTPPGSLSFGNNQNPHFLPDAISTCGSNAGPLGAGLLADLQAAFTTGKLSLPGCATAPVGSSHALATGYATIDVVANCDTISPLAPGYFASEILFDNVLTGDVQHINPNQAIGNYAGGNPLVHIRAIPEGGGAGVFVPTALPYTFYDLYTVGLAPRTYDRRQPLPSAFMPRYIDGGTNAFNTKLQIWREAFAAPAACPAAYARNSAVPAAEAVRFDEHENAAYCVVYGCIAISVPCDCVLRLPSTSSTSAASQYFGDTFSLPYISGDVGGWLFLNLNNGGSSAYSAASGYRFGTTTSGARQSQAWVVTTMFAEGRYSVEMDALAVGNGCSPAPELSTRVPIGPAANPNP